MYWNQTHPSGGLYGNDAKYGHQLSPASAKTSAVQNATALETATTVTTSAIPSATTTTVGTPAAADNITFSAVIRPPPTPGAVFPPLNSTLSSATASFLPSTNLTFPAVTRTVRLLTSSNNSTWTTLTRNWTYTQSLQSTTLIDTTSTSESFSISSSTSILAHTSTSSSTSTSIFPSTSLSTSTSISTSTSTSIIHATSNPNPATAGDNAEKPSTSMVPKPGKVDSTVLACISIIVVLMLISAAYLIWLRGSRRRWRPSYQESFFTRISRRRRPSTQYQRVNFKDGA